MIKPVTFKAAQNFKANLYALSVRSGFIDQDHADGYYKGYGNELVATVVGTSGITIGSGAIVVQGRIIEIVSAETVPIAYEEGKVGYVVCRIETSPETNEVNCTLTVKTGLILSEISLTQEDTYSYESEVTNKVYELPLYSFSMQNATIGNVERRIKEIADLDNLNQEMERLKSGEVHAGFANTASKAYHDGVGNYISNYYMPKKESFYKTTAEVNVNFIGGFTMGTNCGFIPSNKNLDSIIAVAFSIYNDELNKTDHYYGIRTLAKGVDEKGEYVEFVCQQAQDQEYEVSYEITSINVRIYQNEFSAFIVYKGRVGIRVIKEDKRVIWVNTLSESSVLKTVTLIYG